MYRTPPTRPAIRAMLWRPILCAKPFVVFCPMRNRRSFFNSESISHPLLTSGKCKGFASSSRSQTADRARLNAPFLP
jgi:hypothetical protein